MRLLAASLLLLLAGLVSAAGVDNIPPQYRDLQSCIGLREQVLSKIAFKRWHTATTEDEYAAMQCVECAPWETQLWNELIHEAYAWQGSEEDWITSEYQACGGGQI